MGSSTERSSSTQGLLVMKCV